MAFAPREDFSPRRNIGCEEEEEEDENRNDMSVFDRLQSLQIVAVSTFL